MKKLSFFLVIILLIAFLIWRFPYAAEDSESQMRIVYLVMVAVLIGGGMFMHYRRKLRRAIRDGILWLVFFMVIVSAYTYRHEVLNSRIISALVPNKVIKGEGETLEIHKSEDGHFHIELLVNDTRVNFMVDTGASAIVLTKKDAARIGFRESDLEFTQIYHTANGTVRGAPVMLHRIEVGHIAFEGVPASVNEGELNRSLLGMDFFEMLQGFSVTHDTLTLKP